MKIIEIRVPHIASPEVYFHESKAEMRESLMEELDSKGRDYPTNASLKKLMGLVDDFNLFYILSLKEASRHSENGTLPSYQTHKKFETLKKLNRLIDSI